MYKWFKDFHGREPSNLMEAISSREIEYVKKYLSQINKPELKRYPITEAVRKNWKEAVELLLENGADVNVCDHYGNSPLDIAHTSEMIELIERYGGEKGIRTRFIERFRPLLYPIDFR